MKKFLVTFVLLLLLLSISVSFFLYSEAAALAFALNYWIIFFFWMITIPIFHLKIKTSFILSFTFFIMSAFLVGLNIYELGETLMRISLIGWVVSLGYAFFRYRDV